MDSYKVFLTSAARDQLCEHIDYIHYHLRNPIAARSVWEDANQTIAALSTVAGSLKKCDHPVLSELGYRAIRYEKHDYVMLYRIEGKAVYVEGVFHQLQDYENIFADRI